jgi:eukaryotic-like serine/threonine-protein kinase
MGAAMSPNSDCYTEEELIACLEGSLPKNRSQAVETHVAGCSRCTKLAGEIKEYLLRECGSENEGDAARRQGRNNVGALEPEETVEFLGKLKGYEIIRVLGRGGYGIVFEALDNNLHRNVAIKVLTRDLSRMTVSRRRFIREARACASINHPNVVTIHGVDDPGETPFIVMELIQGETLRDRIHRQPKLDLLDILRISSQVAQGLAAAHAQGIIHRDVKPGNIMLLDSVRVKIADFGLARVATENVELTSRGVAVGTPAYMSPEQVRGEELDARSDLFAMGCVMYAMYAGHSPFHGRNALEIAMRIETYQPPRLGELSKGVPEFLDSIVARLLEKDRDKRFQSAAEVADVLSRHLTILNQTPTDRFPVALRMSMLEPSGKSKRSRRPIAFGVSALLAILASAAIAGGWFYFHSADTNAELVGASGLLGPVPEPPAPISVTQRKLDVTVAQTGDADFTTIGEALRTVAPGGTVTIQDDAEYTEAILLTDAAQYEGLRIVSPKHATLRSNAAGPVVTIRSIPRLRWEGLNIQALQMQLGIEINGDCPGLEMTDVEIRRVANPDDEDDTVAAIVLRDGAAGTAEEPLVLRGLHLRETNVGMVIGSMNAESVPPKHIVIEDCEVYGLSRDSSTLLALLLNMEDVSIRRNIFSNGIQGVSIVVEPQKMPVKCDISHNTWHRLDAWFGWTGPVEPPLSIHLHHNLIVAAGQHPLPESFLAAINSLPPVFSANTVVASSVDVGSGFSRLADVVPDFPLLSEDPAHPDYLKPDFERLERSGFTAESVPGRYSAEAEK